MQAASLRQRKKARTRAALIRSAQRLFAERGYRDTTLEDIAADADVHVQTLLRYFPSKERLALAREYDAVEAFIAAVHADGRRDVLTVWRDFVAERFAGNPGRLVFALDLLDEPALAHSYHWILRRYETELAAALAREAGVDGAVDLHSRLVSGVVVEGTLALGERWASQHERVEVDRLLDALVEFVRRDFPARSSSTALDTITRALSAANA